MNPAEFNALARRRRTIKPAELSNRPIEDDVLASILENANWAPTHGMTEPWRFVIFTGDSRRLLGERLSAIYQEITPPDAIKPTKVENLEKNPQRAPVVIAICMKRQETEKIPEMEEVEAVACAVQNMHLTATAYGLGGFWSSNKAACSDAMKDFLQLGEKDKVLGLFYLGYPSGDWPEGTRTPIEAKVEYRN